MAHRTFVTAGLVVGAVLAWAIPAKGQDLATSVSADMRVTLPASLFASAAPAANDASVQPAVAAPVTPAPMDFRPVKTNAALKGSLIGLYATTAIMQVLDVQSTLSVLSHGGAEGNPVMAGLVSNKAAFVAMKVGLAASTILAAHKMARCHKVAAIVTLAAINSVYASVVSHNFKLAAQLR